MEEGEESVHATPSWHVVHPHEHARDRHLDRFSPLYIRLPNVLFSASLRFITVI